MSSLLRIAANHANGAKSRGPVTPEGKRIAAANAAHSTGPVTPEGKACVSQNAVRHGLLAKTVVLPSESSESFEASLNSISEELQPRTYLDGQLVDIIAVSNWKRRRVWHLETAQLTHAVRAQEALRDPIADQENSELPAMHTALAFGSLCDRSGVLDLLHRYEVRFSREFTRHLLLYGARRACNFIQPDFSKQTEAKIGQIRGTGGRIWPSVKPVA